MSAGLFTTADGCTLAYEDTGAGAAVLWQHGLGADRHQPAEVFPAGAKVRRITLECRGHGQSQLGDPARLSIAQFADDAKSLLDRLEIATVIVGGISLGAAMCMRLAASHPLLVRGLILARPAWTDAKAPLTMRPYLLVADLLRQFGCEEGLRRFRESEMHAEIERVSPDNAASLCGFFSCSEEMRTIELLARLPLDGPGLTRPEISSLQVPTCVIGNDQDYVHPMRYASDLTEWIAGAELHVIASKTAGKHLYQAQLQDALAAFLDRCTDLGARS